MCYDGFILDGGWGGGEHLTKVKSCGILCVLWSENGYEGCCIVLVLVFMAF